MTPPTPLLEPIARTLRSPFVPAALKALAGCGHYLDVVWPQLAPSVETAGFRDSARYLADMALDAVRVELEPADASRPLDLDPVLSEAARAVLDVFHAVLPQTLLLCAALSEAAQQPRVGGDGHAEPRLTLPGEAAHLAIRIVLATPNTPPLPVIASTLQLAVAPDLYRALATLPGDGPESFIERAWGETQHLAAFPPVRRRGRALYYYARSAARFLAYPLEADAAALERASVPGEAFEAARSVLADAVPALATELMHCAALSVLLGHLAPDGAG